MGTIAHTFDAGQTVWVITTTTTSCVSAVLGGTVIQVLGIALTTGTTVTYDIRLNDDSGTTRIKEVNIFTTLADAVAEYEIRLT